MNKELYELCKQVYEATGWENDRYVKHLNKAPSYECRYHNASIYTSDYLLEKLSAVTDHVSVNRSNKISIDASNDEKGNWYAHYWLKSRRVQVKSDTPLKALLKLCLALKEAGEL